MNNKEIIKRCVSGDREAMEVLYTTYGPRMMRVIRRYIMSADTAQDLLHDSFIVIFTRIGDVRDSEKLEYWMATIVKNICLTHLSQLDITTLLNEDTTEIEDVPELEELLSFKEIEDLINKLPDGYRNVFRLAVFENKSHREIGEILGIDPHSSSSQLARAKALLRKMIIERKKELGLATVFLILCLSGYVLLNHAIQSSYKISRMETAETPLPSETTHRGDDTTANQSINTLPKVLPNAVASSTGSSASTLQKIISSKLNPAIPDSVESAPANPLSNSTFTAGAISSLKNDQTTTETESTDKNTETIKDNNSLPTHNDTDNHRNTSPIFVKPMFARAGSGSHNSWSFGPQFGLGTVMSVNELDMANDALLSPPKPDHSSNIKPAEVTHVENELPLDFGIQTSKRFTDRISLESGVTFTLLRSKVSYSYGILTRNVRWVYLGVPLNLNVNIWSKRNVSFYGSAGASVNFPIATTFSEKISSDKYIPQAKRPEGKVQFSTKAGIGIQYNLTPHVGLYFEPAFRFNFKNNAEIENYWQEHKTMISIPIGLRFQW